MKKVLIACFFFLCVSAAWAQIPVTDVASNVTLLQQLTNALNQLKVIKDTYKEIQKTYNVVKSYYDLVNKDYNELRQMYGQIMGWVNFFQNFHDHVPQDIYDVQELLEGGGLAADMERLQGDYEGWPSHELFDGAMGSAAAKEYDAQGKRIFSQMALSQKMGKVAKERGKELDKMRTAVERANDPKKIADITARMTAEMLQLLNEQTQMMALQMQMSLLRENEQRNQEARRRASITKASDIKLNK